MASLLSVENLQVQFQTKKGINTAVDGVSFSVEKGRILGIVGESGSGKRVSLMSMMQLIEHPGKIKNGEVFFEGNDLLKKKEKEMYNIFLFVFIIFKNCNANTFICTI